MNEVNHVAEETAKLAGSGQKFNRPHGIDDEANYGRFGLDHRKLAVLSEKTTNINSVVDDDHEGRDQNELAVGSTRRSKPKRRVNMGWALRWCDGNPTTGRSDRSRLTISRKWSRRCSPAVSPE